VNRRASTALYSAMPEARLEPASRVLAPGGGEGRNSVWLAEQGHQEKIIARLVSATATI
jgi:hypothetical protein